MEAALELRVSREELAPVCAPADVVGQRDADLRERGTHVTARLKEPRDLGELFDRDGRCLGALGRFVRGGIGREDRGHPVVVRVDGYGERLLPVIVDRLPARLVKTVPSLASTGARASPAEASSAITWAYASIVIPMARAWYSTATGERG